MSGWQSDDKELQEKLKRQEAQRLAQLQKEATQIAKQKAEAQKKKPR